MTGSEFVWVRRSDLPDPDCLEQLAAWFDGYDSTQLGVQISTEVQEDLRRWAAAVRLLVEDT